MERSGIFFIYHPIRGVFRARIRASVGRVAARETGNSKPRSAPEDSFVCDGNHSLPRCRHYSNHGHLNDAPHGRANVFALRRMHSHRLAHGTEGPSSIPDGEFDARVDVKRPCATAAKTRSPQG